MFSFNVTSTDVLLLAEAYWTFPESGVGSNFRRFACGEL